MSNENEELDLTDVDLSNPILDMPPEAPAPRRSPLASTPAHDAGDTEATRLLREASDDEIRAAVAEVMGRNQFFATHKHWRVATPEQIRRDDAYKCLRALVTQALNRRSAP